MSGRHLARHFRRQCHLRGGHELVLARLEVHRLGEQRAAQGGGGERHSPGRALDSRALKCTMCACLCVQQRAADAERRPPAGAPRRHRAHPARRPGPQADRPGAPAEEGRSRRDPVFHQPRPERSRGAQGERPLRAAPRRGHARQRRLWHPGAVRAAAAARGPVDHRAAHHHRRRAKRRRGDRQGRVAGSGRHPVRRRHHIHRHRQRACAGRAHQPPARAFPGLIMSDTAARTGTTPIVLAYSGGLDTSFLVPWIAEHERRPVITVTVDTGGIDREAARALAARAHALGAVEHHQVDARADYFEQVLRFLIMGNVRRGQLYPLCVGAERVMQAQTIARLARKLGSDTVAHGCTAAGNDQVRFEVALRTLAPDLKVLAPVRDEAFKRQDELEYLQQRGLPVPPTGARYSINRGLWGVTIGGRETLTSAGSIPDDAWLLTRDAFTRPRPAQRHVLGFRQGRPVALDGKAGSPVEIIEALESLAAPFGIGRGIHLGDTIIGTKGRVAFEAPAAEVLLTAHRELEKLTLTGRQQRIKEQLAQPYGDLVHEGQLLDPVCRDIEALLLSSQQRVTGEVHLLLRSGSVFVEGVESPFSLMAASRVVWGETAGEWSASDALGFGLIGALPGLFYTRAGERAGVLPEEQ